MTTSNNTATTPEPTHRGYRMQKFVEDHWLPFVRELNAYGKDPGPTITAELLNKHFTRESLRRINDLRVHFTFLGDDLANLLEAQR